MSDQTEGAIKGLGVFSTLQAATEFKFFLLAATFTLLIDNVFLILHEPGLIELASNKGAFSVQNLTLQVILIFVIFSFLTSLVLPIAAGFFDQIYILTAGNWIARIGIFLNDLFGIKPEPIRRKYNCVRSSELRDEAHRRKEKYYLDLHKEYEDGWYRRRENMFRFALYSFSCLVMLAINFYLGEKSASNMIGAFFGNSDVIWLALCALLFMVVWRFYDESDPDWIYCPSLYEKLHEKERKEKEDRERWFNGR